MAPLFSVLVPVFDPNPAHLQAAIESVLAQTFGDWELCLVDDCSTDARVARMLDHCGRRDSRIRVRRRTTNGGISAATNDALGLATGEYVAFLDHDDILDADALQAFADAIQSDPNVDFLYSDEDKLSPNGTYTDVFHKPAFSPEYLLSCMYTCHFTAYRRALVVELGGLRSEFDGSQDYDLALRVVERTKRVTHVPRVLYHWRMAPGSTAADLESKPHAYEAGRRAIEDHLRRTGRAGRCDDSPLPGWYRVRYDVRGDPPVSIIVPSAGRSRLVRGEPLTLVTNCVRSVLATTSYANYEVLIVLDRNAAPETERALESLADDRVRIVPYDGAFNFSRKINLGAARAKGDHLLLLNDDIEVIDAEWLTAMLEFSQQPEIGAVGAKLLFADGSIQHGGVVMPRCMPGHVFYGYPGTHPGYFGNLMLNVNYSAVTGACLMTRMNVFEEVGGLSPSFPTNFNDIDYCMKLRFHGYRIVFTPYARLYHFESSSRVRGVAADEVHQLHARWSHRIEYDPYYNPNFRADVRDFLV